MRVAKNLLTKLFQGYSKYILTLESMQGLTDQEYAKQRDELGRELGAQWNVLRGVWPPFAALALYRGIPEGGRNSLSELQNYIKAAKDDLAMVAETLVSNARFEAEEIEQRARGNARSFSVRAAQDEFDRASSQLRHMAIGWGALSLLLFAFFVWFAFYIYNHPPNLFSTQPNRGSNLIAEAIYFSAIRVTILTAFGALATFCLRMLRAHLHMSALNDHRRRVANSMAAFVEAANTPEQRDIIFGKLVDSVVNFGNSGILENTGDTLSVPSVAIEAVTKNLLTKN